VAISNRLGVNNRLGVRNRAGVISRATVGSDLATNNRVGVSNMAVVNNRVMLNDRVGVNNSRAGISNRLGRPGTPSDRVANEENHPFSLERLRSMYFASWNMVVRLYSVARNGLSKCK